MENKMKAQIQDVIDRHAKFKNCYFWTPNTNAAGRRRLERDNSVELKFVMDNKKYEVCQSLDVSCRNFYYVLRVYVDGVKKDIRALKKII